MSNRFIMCHSFSSQHSSMSRQRYNKISLVDRERICAAFDADEDWRTLASQLNIKPQTARSILLRYRENGTVAPSPKGGRRNVKVDEEMKEEILKIVEEDCQVTLVNVNNRLRQRLPHKPHLTEQTVSRILDGNLITLKISKSVTVNWNHEEVKIQRQDFANWMMESGMGRERIYIDECGFNMHTRRSQGRSLVGIPAVRVLGGQCGQNLTFCLAASPRHGILHYVFVEGGMKNDRFQDFLMELSTLMGDTNDVCFIFDNARCHSNVPNFNFPTHECFPLPPYSPFLNIIEMCFSSIKSRVKNQLSDPDIRRQVNDKQAARQLGLNLHTHRMRILRKLIEESTDMVTSDMCAQFDTHSMKYIPQCIRMDDILY